jgi:two-component system chemotaxis response regulator CheB
VVFGMPKEAIKMGAADKVLPLDKIPMEMMRMV